MAKQPVVNTISSGYASQSQLNENFSNIQTSFNNTLSLDGSTPNAMQANIDMNNNDIINVSGIYVGGVNVLNVLDNVTVSTAYPSGGNDGDIWFRVSS
ncbi:putative structural protein [Roseobacter phage CRP-4]|jgi:hypothetical protein|uniref:Putative structural protein n=1 Tax=Roseobacter phage CRP-4 TaxID=2559283 RepID=A0A646QW77_9CAUD|nr:putative structural protein [Roseobacter phage CRP-4]